MELLEDQFDSPLPHFEMRPIPESPKVGRARRPSCLHGSIYVCVGSLGGIGRNFSFFIVNSFLMLAFTQYHPTTTIT